MFDDLDIEKLEEEDVKRQEIKKNFEQYGSDELELAQLREGFLSKTVEANVKSLKRLEENLEELSDDKLIISDAIEKFSDEENKEEENNKEEIEENSTNENGNETSVEEADVNSDALDTKQELNNWEKEKQELEALMRQKDELLIKMYQEIQNANQQQSFQKEVKEEPKTDDIEQDIIRKAKEIIEDISHAEEDSASYKLAKLLLTISNKKEPDLDEGKIEEFLSKREQKKYIEKFEQEKIKFFNSDEGKKILADEDLLDLYQVKFKRLQETGKHLNPEDLFKAAYENTTKVFFSGNRTSSSTAKVPKVSNSLKDDVSKVEDTKRQAVKPTSSSNAGKPAETKKFNHIDAYKEYLKSIGQTI